MAEQYKTKQLNCVIRKENTMLNICFFYIQHEFTSVIHFAGLKNVGESCEQPLLYYNVNVGGAINLLEVRQQITYH